MEMIDEVFCIDTQYLENAPTSTFTPIEIIKMLIGTGILTWCLFSWHELLIFCPNISLKIPKIVTFFQTGIQHRWPLKKSVGCYARH